MSIKTLKLDLPGKAVFETVEDAQLYLKSWHNKYLIDPQPTGQQFWKARANPVEVEVSNDLVVSLDEEIIADYRQCLKDLA